MSTSRSAFRGPRRKLVLAFDVGTTYSGISYRCASLEMEAMDARSTDSPDNSVLDPGVVPEIKGVTRSVEVALNSLLKSFIPIVL